MEPKPRKQTRDCFRMIFSRKRKHSKKKTGADDTDRDRIASPPQDTSFAANDVVRSPPGRNVDEVTSAVHSSAHVNTVSTDNIALGGGTEEGTSSTKEESALASYLSAGALIADSVAQLSEAIPPLQLTMNILKVILENASVSRPSRVFVHHIYSQVDYGRKQNRCSRPLLAHQAFAGTSIRRGSRSMQDPCLCIDEVRM